MLSVKCCIVAQSLFQKRRLCPQKDRALLSSFGKRLEDPRDVVLDRTRGVRAQKLCDNRRYRSHGDAGSGVFELRLRVSGASSSARWITATYIFKL